MLGSVLTVGVYWLPTVCVACVYTACYSMIQHPYTITNILFFGVSVLCVSGYVCGGWVWNPNPLFPDALKPFDETASK